MSRQRTALSITRFRGATSVVDLMWYVQHTYTTGVNQIQSCPRGDSSSLSGLFCPVCPALELHGSGGMIAFSAMVAATGLEALFEISGSALRAE